MLCAVGLVELVVLGVAAHRLLGHHGGGLAFLALFFGQRIAKDYTGAAVIPAYFLVALVGLWMTGRYPLSDACPGDRCVFGCFPDGWRWRGWPGRRAAGVGGRPGLVSITRRAGELSIVCAEARVPPEVRAERGWRALEVQGPIDFEEVGVLHALSGPLARAGVSVFAVATFDTDLVLVREETLDRAVEALRVAGHTAGTLSRGLRRFWSGRPGQNWPGGEASGARTMRGMISIRRVIPVLVLVLFPGIVPPAASAADAPAAVKPGRDGSHDFDFALGRWKMPGPPAEGSAHRLEGMVRDVGDHRAAGRSGMARGTSRSSRPTGPPGTSRR